MKVKAQMESGKFQATLFCLRRKIEKISKYDSKYILFADRDIALQKVLDAESKAPKGNDEISYEEY